MRTAGPSKASLAFRYVAIDIPTARCRCRLVRARSLPAAQCRCRASLPIHPVAVTALQCARTDPARDTVRGADLRAAPDRHEPDGSRNLWETTFMRHRILTFSFMTMFIAVACGGGGSSNPPAATIGPA